MSSDALWLCLELPRLALDALAVAPLPQHAGDVEARAVYARHGSRRWIVASGEPRVAPGEALGSVQARFPELRLLPRDPAAEAAALQAVGCAAYQLSDRVVLVDEAPRGLFDRPFQAVLIDVAPSLRLFGGLDALGQRAQSLMNTLPYAFRCGLAPTPLAAAVVARAQLAPVATPAALRAALAPLPIARLRWPLDAEETLRASGHATLGDVLRHGAGSLAARLGRAFPQALARLLGDAPDPRAWFVPPPRYRRKLDLDAEIDDWQALLFPLRRLFDEFETYLRARQVTTAQLDVLLSRQRTEHERFVLRTTTPTQDAAVFLRLLREQWNGRPPTAPASELRLRADRFTELAPPQTQLFDDGHAEGEAWNALADRLRARLGDAALWRPALADDHRPERAWTRDFATAAAAAAPMPAPAPQPPRPLWLLREPRPFRSRQPVASAPERLGGGWWDGAPVERDYHRAAGADGEPVWVYRDRLTGAWWQQGAEFGGPAEDAPTA